jgi:hypothetical protein
MEKKNIRWQLIIPKIWFLFPFHFYFSIFLFQIYLTQSVVPHFEYCEEWKLFCTFKATHSERERRRKISTFVIKFKYVNFARKIVKALNFWDSTCLFNWLKPKWKNVKNILESNKAQNIVISVIFSRYIFVLLWGQNENENTSKWNLIWTRRKIYLFVFWTSEQKSEWKYPLRILTL